MENSSSSTSPMEISSPSGITTSPILIAFSSSNTPSPNSSPIGVPTSPISYHSDQDSSKTPSPYSSPIGVTTSPISFHSDQDSSKTPSPHSSPSSPIPTRESFTPPPPTTDHKITTSPIDPRISQASIVTAVIRGTFKRKTHCFEKYDLSLPIPFPVYVTNDEIPHMEYIPHVFQPVPPPHLRRVHPPVPLMKKLQHLQNMFFYWKGGKVVKFPELLPSDAPIVFKIVMDKRVTSFTVNNGPRRSLDHIPNLVFLDSVTNRICPNELVPEDKDVVCYFSYVKSSSY